MGPPNVQSPRSGVWALADTQHGVVTRRQLLQLGLSRDAISHRIARGRLHPVWRGVYAVGRPQLTQHGRWMAAVLSCGPGAALSHASAAALWEIGPAPRARIDVSVPLRRRAQRPGIVVHRRSALAAADVTRHHHVPVTTPISTLIDLAAGLAAQWPRTDGIVRGHLEAAVNEADRRGLTDPEELRVAVDRLPRRPGSAVLRRTLDHRTFTLTDSELERRFLPIARSAGLPAPETGRWVNGFRVDFHWPDLGLVVETDGLRYHRTPAQQARDRLRDQAHTAAGLTPLRFTRAQVVFAPGHVEATLAVVARRLRRAAGPR